MVGVVLSIVRVNSQRRVGLPETLPLPDASFRPDYIPTHLPGLDQMKAMIPTSTPGTDPRRPVQLVIPSQQIDVEVVHINPNEDELLEPPDWTAGYWLGSAKLDEVGTVLIVGHNREEPAVIFRDLINVERGAEIQISDQYGTEYRYKVSEIDYVDLNEAGAGERLLSYIESDDSTRLTLVTCYPPDVCAERFVVVAVPVE